MSLAQSNGRADEPEARPLRIAHLADTHLGYSAYGRADPETGRNQRAVDVERSFEAAITDILEQGVDLVVHAGDVFHHTRPSWSTLAHFVRQMRRLELVGLPVVVIAGNHDTPRLRTTGSVFGLLALALPGVIFITGYETGSHLFAELGVRVHGIPHGSLVNPDPPEIVLDRHVRNIGVTHGTAPGYTVRSGHEAGEVDLPGHLLDAQFDYVALGHEHVRGQAASNAWYSGSTERMSWRDEAAQPGYALVTVGKRGSVPQVELRDVPARPMKTLAPIDGSERSARDIAEQILNRAGAQGMPDAMFRIELQQTPRPLFRETEAIVRRETSDNAWYIRLTAPGDLVDPLGRDAISGLADLHPLRLFEQFVDQRIDAGVYDPEFAERFRARGRTALETAARRAQEVATSEGATP